MVAGITGNAIERRYLIRLILTAIWCAFGLASFAQLPTATILGTVKDSSGAVVPAAKVTARSLETGQSRTTTSAADGSYRLPALPVGSYEVRAEQSGFQTSVQTGLTLAVSQEAVVNFSLQVGAVEQSVAVTAEAPLVNTTSGSLGGLVDEQKVADLPLNGRNYIDLGLLQTGVQQDNVNRGGNTGGPVMVGTWFSSNGAPPRSNNYMLDGAILQNYNNSTSAGSSGSTLGVEGVREFRLVTNSFSAEYGLRMGSQMTIVSKSGTNSFHGSAYEYLRNSVLDARNFFDRQTPLNGNRRLPAFTRNQFGASFGGPIRKDRTFFFGVYESLKERLGRTTRSTTLAAGCRAPANATITNVQCRQLGQTQTATIAPQIVPFLALYPLPNLEDTLFTFPFSQPTDEYYGQMRVDHTIAANDNIFARYTGDDTSQILPFSFPQFKDNRLSRSQFVTISEDHVFSPVLLNSARVSFSRTKLAGITTSGLGGPQLSFVPGQDMGNLTVGGLSSMGGGSTEPSISMQNVYTFSDDLFLTRTRHAIKMGTLINHFRQPKVQGTNGRGVAVFSGIPQLLQAQPLSIAAVTPGTTQDRDYRFYTVGFYIQDDWRVKSTLTLNVGLRYEFATVPTERFNRRSNLRDITRDRDFTVGPMWKNNSLKNFSPRFGFAWDVSGNGRTAVRGGFGVLYDIANVNSLRDLGNASSPPFSSQSSLANPSTLTVPFVFPSANVGRAVRPPDYNMQQPHMLQYNLTVERQLPWQAALTLAYAGSRGLNIPLIMEGNPTVPQILPDGRKFWTGNDPRINPFWDSIEYGAAAGNSWYNSMQVGVTKRLTKGLQFQSSYTYAKVMDETEGQIIGESSVGPPDPSNIKLDKAPAGFDATQNWHFNTIYKLPGTATGIRGAVLNGWWISSIVGLQTGFPLNVRVQNNRSRSKADITGFGGSTDRPDLLPGRSNDNIVHGTSKGCLGVPAGQPLGGPDFFLDTCAFAIQPFGFLGTAGRNILRGPGTVNLDFSIGKDTAIKYLGEAGKLAFRAEFFNVMNRANLDQPGISSGAIIYAATATGFGSDVERPLAAGNRITRTATTARQIQFALKLQF